MKRRPGKCALNGARHERMPSSFAPFPRRFFEARADRVARQLLGHWLVRRTSQGLCGGVILETEAYLENDPASHGYGGERTRNRSMYGPPGHAYVYLIYGMHYCFNVVCAGTGVAEAVLVRAIEVLWGQEQVAARRAGQPVRAWTNGPAKVCQALDIDRRFDGLDLCDAKGPLFLARNPQAARFLRQHGPLQVTPRIGITKAAHWPLRFVLSQPGR